VKCLEPWRAACFPGRVKRIVLVSALVIAIASVVPAAASAALKATQIRVGNHPAFVRVVVDFTGGTLHANDAESPDPNPFDGRARVRVTAAGITSDASRVTGERVTARVVERSGFIVLRLTSRQHRFKYLEHGVLHSPERLVVDLWKARPPTAAAEFTTAPQGGCLTIDSIAAAAGRITANGTETDLFEHMFQADVRNRKGRVVGTRPVTASGGHWHRSVAYTVGGSQAGTFEVVDFSEQDGSLSCIAQVRVALTPAP
jgi:immunoglobulin-like protein involved in spore germination